MTRFLPPLKTLLPAEHGSWFMLGFPLVLALIVRPSPAALCLGLAALSLFLGRPTLRRVLNGQKDPAFIRALLLLGGTAVVFGFAAWRLSDARFLIPLAVVGPLVIYAMQADVHREARSLGVEMAAQGAFAGLAAAMLVGSGGTLVEAGRAWLFVSLLGSANLAHVRRILGHAHGFGAAELSRRMLLVHLLHLLLVGASALMMAFRSFPGALWMGWTILLYLRALAPYRPIPARTLGWREGGLSVLGLLLLWRALL